MWRVLDIKEALLFTILVKKEYETGNHMNNVHFMVVSSRWELRRKVIMEDSNSYKLLCVALLSGLVRGPTSRRGLLGKGRLLGPRFIHC